METKKITYTYCLLKIRPVRNNTFVTLTTPKGVVIAKSSAGQLDFSGKKKKTAYVAETITKSLLLNLQERNIKVKMFLVQLIGSLRHHSFKRSISAIDNMDIEAFLYINTIMRLPHSRGVRSRKMKRL